MGPVDEAKQIFTLDCYFRQFWTDERLIFNHSQVEELAMNWQFLSKVGMAPVCLKTRLNMSVQIWRPDTYFMNGQASYLHKFAVPNRFIRISPNGRISFSQRLTITARCHMNLRKFPLDSQSCPLDIASFGFTEDQVNDCDTITATTAMTENIDRSSTA